MKTLAFCLLLGSLGAALAMDRVAAQTVLATGAQLVTLGTAGGPLPRANRAQPFHQRHVFRKPRPSEFRISAAKIIGRQSCGTLAGHRTGQES